MSPNGKNDKRERRNRPPGFEEGKPRAVYGSSSDRLGEVVERVTLGRREWIARDRLRNDISSHDTVDEAMRAVCKKAWGTS